MSKSAQGIFTKYLRDITVCVVFGFMGKQERHVEITIGTHHSVCFVCTGFYVPIFQN